MKKIKDSQLVSFEEVKADFLKKKWFRDEYYKKDLDFEIAKEVMRARISQGLTQKELAKKVKTQQPSIARLESGAYTPSFRLLRAVAKALNVNLDVHFTSMRELDSSMSKYSVEPRMKWDASNIASVASTGARGSVSRL